MLCEVSLLPHLDVPVNDPPGVAGEHGLNDLPEEVPRQILAEPTLRGDVVEEILAGFRPLHYLSTM